MLLRKASARKQIDSDISPQPRSISHDQFKHKTPKSAFPIKKIPKLTPRKYDEESEQSNYPMQLAEYIMRKKNKDSARKQLFASPDQFVNNS